MLGLIFVPLTFVKAACRFGTFATGISGEQPVHPTGPRGHDFFAETYLGEMRLVLLGRVIIKVVGRLAERVIGDLRTRPKFVSVFVVAARRIGNAEQAQGLRRPHLEWIGLACHGIKDC